MVLWPSSQMMPGLTSLLRRVMCSPGHSDDKVVDSSTVMNSVWLRFVGGRLEADEWTDLKASMCSTICAHPHLHVLVDLSLSVAREKTKCVFRLRRVSCLAGILCAASGIFIADLPTRLHTPPHPPCLPPPPPLLPTQKKGGGGREKEVLADLQSHSW